MPRTRGRCSYEHGLPLAADSGGTEGALLSDLIPDGRTGVCRWGLYVSRANPELTDGCPSRGAQGGKKLGGAQSYLLSHDRLVRLDGSRAVAEAYQAARTDG